MRRKRFRLLDIEGEGGGDDAAEGARAVAGCCFGASPADCVRESSLLEGGTARELDVVVGAAEVAVVAVDVAVATAACSSWLWVMLW